MPAKILVLSASVGAGHLRAAKAVELALRELAPDAMVERVNLRKFCSLIECESWDAIVNTHFLPASIIAALRSEKRIKIPQIKENAKRIATPQAALDVARIALQFLRRR